jgi:hypothetical protein
MENDPNNTNAPATKDDLNAEFSKFEQKLDEKLDERLSEQANLILEPSAGLRRRSWIRNSIP